MIPPRLIHFALTIDGKPEDFHAVRWHYHEDPFPGGHQYELKVSGALTEELASLLPSNTERVPRSEANWFFTKLYLEESRANLEKLQGPRAEYMLNTIDSYSTDGETLVLRGVCSPIIHPDATSDPSSERSSDGG